MRAIVEAELRRLGVRPRDLNVVAELGLQESSQTAVEEGLGATFKRVGPSEATASARNFGTARAGDAGLEGIWIGRSHVDCEAARREHFRPSVSRPSSEAASRGVSIVDQRTVPLRT